MEAFSLLKYWRGGGGGAFTRELPCNPRPADSSCSFSSSTTIVTAVSPSSSSDSDDEGNDDGPFFDLEFTLPDDDSDSDQQTKNQVDNDVAVAPKVVVQESENVDNINERDSAEEDVSDDDENEDTAEIKFTISSSSTSPPNNATFSPPPANDDLFFPMDSSSMLLNATSETIPKFLVSSILKSATKFRVQMLKFNKSNKSDSRQKDKPKEETKSVQKKEQQPKEEGREDPKPNSKLLTVKLKVEEVMPLISLLFTRDQNSSSNSKGTTNSKSNKRDGGEINNSGATDAVETITNTSPSNEDEKKFSMDVMNKYLKKVKPLYVRVSKRYGDKLRFSGQLSFPKPTAQPDDADKQPTSVVKPSEAAAEVAQAGAVSNALKNQKQGNLQAGLRVVCKHLGKSRSASASVPAPAATPEASRRRDDSLLQQQDGIQSAILHCKRSFNASRGEREPSILSRSVSDSSSHENR